MTCLATTEKWGHTHTCTLPIHGAYDFHSAQTVQDGVVYYVTWLDEIPSAAYTAAMDEINLATYEQERDERTH